MCNVLNCMLQFNKDVLYKLIDGDIELVKFIKCEKVIILLMSKGLKNKEIVEDLSISLYIVKIYLYSVFRKIKCCNCIELLLWVQ